MQRKTLLSACIALALSGQGWAADITEVETTTGEKKNTNVTCPADPGKLSPEELKRLPSECSPLVEQNLMPWLSTGAAALITALAVVELNDDDDHHHRNNSPLPPTPPDDESDDTPVPPTPGGDEIIPDDPDDTPTPPKPVSFNNDVILDKTEKTLTIRDSVFTYTENADGTISLQDSNGRKATINLWQIDEANNTVALEGVSADGATKWQYNHNGELVITGDNATVNNNGKTTVDGKDPIRSPSVSRLTATRRLLTTKARAPSPTVAPARRLTVMTPRQTTTAKPPLTARIPPVRKSTVITGK